MFFEYYWSIATKCEKFRASIEGMPPHIYVLFLRFNIFFWLKIKRKSFLAHISRPSPPCWRLTQTTDAFWENSRRRASGGSTVRTSCLPVQREYLLEISFTWINTFQLGYTSDKDEYYWRFWSYHLWLLSCGYLPKLLWMSPMWGFPERWWGTIHHLSTLLYWRTILQVYIYATRAEFPDGDPFWSSETGT